MSSVSALLHDLRLYKTTNVDFHAGDVYQHSVWSAMYVNWMFKTKHPNTEGVDEIWKNVLVVAGLLHDIGKGGDGNLVFFDKPNHPEIGGYYFDRGYYTTVDKKRIDLHQVLTEFNLEKYYKIIAFLVTWHWMIGGVLAKAEPSKEAWQIYGEFNKACLSSGYSYEHAECLFELLYIVWTSDLMAAQRFPHPVNDFLLNLENPPATHKGANIYGKLKIGTFRKEVISHYNTSFVVPVIEPSFELRNGHTLITGGKAYTKNIKSSNPFLWIPVEMSKVPRKFNNKEFFESNLKACLNRMINPLQIPLFQSFPTALEGLNRDDIVRLYAIICEQNVDWIYSFPIPVKDQWTDQDLKMVEDNTNVYFGRGYEYCEPPNISNSRGLWAFLEKKYAYAYAVGRDVDENFPTKGYCWNILTMKTLKPLRLLNLSLRSVRDQVRKDLADMPVESWWIISGIMDHRDFLVYSDIIDFMFPKDVDPTKDQRFSQTEIDIEVAKNLALVYPNIDGWYIECPEMSPEIVIFHPFDSVEQVEHEAFDANRLKMVLDRCGGGKDCELKITNMFKEQKVICLIYPDSQVRCYLLEELLDRKILSEEQYQIVLAEIRKGNININII